MSLTIGASQALDGLRRTDEDLQTLGQQLSTGRKINTAADDPVSWERIQRSRREYSELNSLNDSLNSVASSIKTADNSMIGIGKLVEQMKANLDAIRKQYPPFPLESEERRNLLRSLSALRQQIDQLAFPPDEGARKIMADPVLEGNWTIVIGADGQMRTLPKEEVHTGPSGLNIPVLDETASDQQIEDAYAALNAATVTLQQRRINLQNDASTVAQSIAYNTTIADVHAAYAENSGAADDTETAMLLKSLQVSQQVALETLKIINDDGARYLRMLG